MISVLIFWHNEFLWNLSVFFLQKLSVITVGQLEESACVKMQPLIFVLALPAEVLQVKQAEFSSFRLG